MESSKEARIFLSSPHMSKEGYELEYIKEAFASNWVAPLGANVDGFEKELAQRLACNGALALASGTAALHMALRAAGVEDGDTVFCQDLTFVATANPIVYQRALPVFVDSDLFSWNMCPQALEEAIKAHPEGKAVLVTHLYGLAADLDKIMALCRQYDLVLIEDAAESLGTLYKGQETGTFGDYGVFSFNGNKIITSSGGGMLVSANQAKLDKVKFWATQARDKARHYQHSELGFNYRMSNIVAGIGRGQLKVLDERIRQKKYIFDFYKKELGHLEGLEFMPINDWNEPNYWLSCLTVQKPISPLMIIEALEKNNIESRPLWKPMHLQPLYEDCPYFGQGIGADLFANGLCLPSDSKMTDEDLFRVTGIIKKLWE